MLCCFPQAVGKNPYVSVKPYFNPHFLESIWNPKNFQIFLFILSVFKLLATECLFSLENR